MKQFESRGKVMSRSGVSVEERGGISLRVVERSDFGAIRSGGDGFFFDNSMAIHVLLTSSNPVHVLVAPRRFGKTTLCTMMEAFFSGRDPESSVAWFRGLAIESAVLARGELAMSLQGRFPVIFLTFKDIIPDGHDDFCAKVALLMERLVTEQYDDLRTSERLSVGERERLNRLAGRAEGLSVARLGDSLRFLMHVLEKHAGNRVVLILDEYDKPIHEAFQRASKADVRRILAFMSTFLGAALKDNRCLGYAFLTGVLRIGLDSLFSGLNNTEVYTLLDDHNPYQQFLGFPEAEVRRLVRGVGLDEGLMESIQAWYDGYQFGVSPGRYNPRSVLACVSNAGVIRPYWVDTGSFDLLVNFFSRIRDREILESLTQLCSGVTKFVSIESRLRFSSDEVVASDFWNVLLQSGYLTKVGAAEGRMIHVKIPNREVIEGFQFLLRACFGGGGIQEDFSRCFDALSEGNPAVFLDEIARRLDDTAGSTMLQVRTPEVGYQLFMLGMLLESNRRYLVHPELKMGRGRADIVLLPNLTFMGWEGLPAYIFELKKAAHVDHLERQVKDALEQIRSQRYLEELQGRGFKRAICVGVAFFRHQLSYMIDRYFWRELDSSWSRLSSHGGGGGGGGGGAAVYLPPALPAVGTKRKASEGSIPEPRPAP